MGYEDFLLALSLQLECDPDEVAICAAIERLKDERIEWETAFYDSQPD